MDLQNLVSEAFGEMSKALGACHKDLRQKEKKSEKDRYSGLVQDVAPARH